MGSLSAAVVSTLHATSYTRILTKTLNTVITLRERGWKSVKRGLREVSNRGRAFSQVLWYTVLGGW